MSFHFSSQLVVLMLVSACCALQVHAQYGNNNNNYNAFSGATQQQQHQQQQQHHQQQQQHHHHQQQQQQQQIVQQQQQQQSFQQQQQQFQQQQHQQHQQQRPIISSTSSTTTTSTGHSNAFGPTHTTATTASKPAKDHQKDYVDYFNHRYPDGSYEFRYELLDGTARYERGYYMLYDKVKTIVVVGYYSYRSPKNEYITVFYNADQNGYRQNLSITPQVYPNLPRSIDVPEFDEVKYKTLNANEANVRGQQQQQQQQHKQQTGHKTGAYQNQI